MKTGFVILRKGFEYNDEINNPIEGGHPHLIVFSRDEAKKVVDELNSKEFKQTSLNEYAYDLMDVLDVTLEEYNYFNDSLVQKYGQIVINNRWESVENRLHPMANEEEVKKYCDMVSFSFYEVIETELSQQSFRDRQINDIIN